MAQQRTKLRDELVKAGIDPMKAQAQIESLTPEVAAKLTTLIALDKSVEDFKARLKTMQEHKPPPPPYAMAVQEKEKPADCPRFSKGDVKLPQEIVPRGTLSTIALPFGEIPRGESGRRQLAEWIAHPENPLTGRVIVNRLWQHLFGRGLVETPDDFGTMGARPTHPALLDDLAFRFVRNGWDMKALLRELALSHTYRQASRRRAGRRRLAARRGEQAAVAHEPQAARSRGAARCLAGGRRFARSHSARGEPGRDAV